MENNEAKEQEQTRVGWDLIKLDRPFLVPKETENSHWAYTIILSNGIGQMLLPYAMIKQMFLEGSTYIEMKEQEQQEEVEKENDNETT